MSTGNFLFSGGTKGDIKMHIKELEEYLGKNNLNTIHDLDGRVIAYRDGASLYQDGVFEKTPNVFGILKVNDEKYCFFITNSSDGTPCFRKYFDNEESACEALVTKIIKFEKMHLDKGNSSVRQYRKGICSA